MSRAGLLRGGAGTALIGSHDEAAGRIAEYYALGIGEFILSGWPRDEQATAGRHLVSAPRRAACYPLFPNQRGADRHERHLPDR